MADKSIENILREIVAVDRNILNDRAALLKKLEAAVSGVRMLRDLAPIKTALTQANVGEIFLAADSSPAAQQKAQIAAMKRLLATNMQETRARFVVDAFAGALGWAKDAAPSEKIVVASEETAPQEKYVAANEEIVPSEIVATDDADEKNSRANGWTCVCGKENGGFFCTACNTSREAAARFTASAKWICVCGKENDTFFCTACNTSRETALTTR